MKGSYVASVRWDLRNTALGSVATAFHGALAFEFCGTYHGEPDVAGGAPVPTQSVVACTR